MAIKFEDDPGEGRKTSKAAKPVPAARAAEQPDQGADAVTQLPFGKVVRPDKKKGRR
ncbi:MULTISPECIES: hypothetical protein [Lichenihabitans]|uniref:hypothetical protein n=1 Tax=Lichenihabitans TaxID=2723776 RepID=UPI0013F15C35|nr:MULTISPECIES: hypothetical protein [Lichenihabitans]UDL94131.1 hypothetical protein LGH83_16595 [Lichenihabitans sp. PAMC28606]